MTIGEMDVRTRKQQDLDDVLMGITEVILARRHAGRPDETVFPKYFYCNTRTWEDEVGPMVADYLTECQIEVRTHNLIPWEKFCFTQTPQSPRDIGMALRQDTTIGLLL